MANTIELAQKFLPVLDGVYKKASLTSVLDANTQVSFDGTNTVKVMKVTTTGLGDYSRANGYAKGNATLTWESLALGEDRSAEFEIDRMDDEETLAQAFGMTVQEFNRVNVGPELDAYRFAKYASTAGIGSASGALADGAAVVSALRDGTDAMDEEEVNMEDRVLFITPTYYGAVEDLDTTKSRAVLGRFGTIIQVPQARFFSGITLNNGASSWGYAKGAEAKNINFMIVSKSAVLQAKKLALPKIFTPDENQSKDAWKFQYRLYHDAFVFENKAKGIFAHLSTT